MEADIIKAKPSFITTKDSMINAINTIYWIDSFIIYLD